MLLVYPSITVGGDCPLFLAYLVDNIVGLEPRLAPRCYHFSLNLVDIFVLCHEHRVWSTIDRNEAAVGGPTN